MNDVAPISALAPAAPPAQLAQASEPTGPSFGRLLIDGLSRVDARLAAADALVAEFAVDNSVPLHQVTIALEEARLAVELMTLVRSRLVESYQEMMRMQL